ncbi:hypothetical protein, partial [Primorskyibacter sedentarius]|uniref:hypothetical protein n=1 Tax=Primorskyibacter sedentarius TaxID=745311 RepID=UPI001A9D9BF0
ITKSTGSTNCFLGIGHQHRPKIARRPKPGGYFASVHSHLDPLGPAANFSWAFRGALVIPRLQPGHRARHYAAILGLAKDRRAEAMYRAQVKLTTCKQIS